MFRYFHSISRIGGPALIRNAKTSLAAVPQTAKWNFHGSHYVHTANGSENKDSSTKNDYDFLRMIDEIKKNTAKNLGVIVGDALANTLIDLKSKIEILAKTNQETVKKQIEEHDVTIKINNQVLLEKVTALQNTLNSHNQEIGVSIGRIETTVGTAENKLHQATENAKKVTNNMQSNFSKMQSSLNWKIAAAVLTVILLGLFSAENHQVNAGTVSILLRKIEELAEEYPSSISSIIKNCATASRETRDFISFSTIYFKLLSDIYLSEQVLQFYAKQKEEVRKKRESRCSINFWSNDAAEEKAISKLEDAELCKLSSIKNSLEKMQIKNPEFAARCESLKEEQKYLTENSSNIVFTR